MTCRTSSLLKRRPFLPPGLTNLCGLNSTTASPATTSWKGEDGTVAAYADLWLIADEGQLANIAVHPSARGLGYGETLLRTAMEALFHDGCRSVFLEVRLSNAAAIALYEKLGYEKTAIRKGYYSQPVEDAYIMNCTKENYRWLRHLV